jgi:hypothetical protein
MSPHDAPSMNHCMVTKRLAWPEPGKAYKTARVEKARRAQQERRWTSGNPPLIHWQSAISSPTCTGAFDSSSIKKEQMCGGLATDPYCCSAQLRSRQRAGPQPKLATFVARSLGSGAGSLYSRNGEDDNQRDGA